MPGGLANEMCDTFDEVLGELLDGVDRRRRRGMRFVLLGRIIVRINLAGHIPPCLTGKTSASQYPGSLWTSFPRGSRNRLIGSMRCGCVRNWRCPNPNCSAHRGAVRR